MEVQALLWWLVFRRLDGITLGAACCVSREWLKAASDEDLWKSLACEKWPSLATDSGRRLLKSFGRSYKHFYAERIRAARIRLRPWPDLQMCDLSVLLDVTFNGNIIASVIRRGDEIAPMYPPDSWEGSMFRFKLGMTEADLGRERELVRLSSLGDGSGAGMASPSRLLGWPEEASASDSTSLRKLRRCDVQNFEVNWAVMMQGSSKILQVLRTKGGTFVDNVCSFSGRLPRISGYPQAASNRLAEVDLVFQTPPTADIRRHHCSQTFLHYSTFTEARISVINEDSWRFVSHNEALGYLQQLFQNHQ